MPLVLSLTLCLILGQILVSQSVKGDDNTQLVGCSSRAWQVEEMRNGNYLAKSTKIRSIK